MFQPQNLNPFKTGVIAAYWAALLFWPIAAWADASRDIAYSTFDRVSASNSLSQKTVQVIFQDSNGLIWIGTQEGLNLYDGRRFHIFRHRNDQTDSLSHDVIKSIAESPDGQIYVATRGGLDILAKDWARFHHVSIKDASGRPVSRINQVYFTPSGDLWVGTDGQGVFFRKSAPGIPATDSLAEVIPNIDVTSIFKDSRQRIWIGTDGHGVFLNKGDDTWTNLTAENANLLQNRVRDIAENKKGQIWVATRSGGINLFDEVSEKFVTYKASNKLQTKNGIYKLLFDLKDNLWAATDNGIAVLPVGEREFIAITQDEANPKSLSHNRVLTLMQDSAGLIWVGTISGLNIYNPLSNKIVNYRHSATISGSLTHQTITHFENDQTSLLVSTYGGGIERLNTDSRQFHPIASVQKGNLPDNRVMTMLLDRDSKLWVGTRASGVWVLDKNNKPVRRFTAEGDQSDQLSANGITDILEDKNGDIWIATYRAGLNLFDKDQRRFRHFRRNSTKSDENIPGLKSENIYQILEDEDGYIWLATDGGGLSRLDRHKRQAITIIHQPEIAGSLSGDIIMSMLIDSKGRFWIGTQGNGLNRWEPQDRRNLRQNFKHYAHQQGLESSSINGILEDDDGFIWLSTNQGVSQLDPETDRFRHFNFSEKDGGNELNQGALIKANDGRFYFGGVNGISAFYPKDLTTNSHIPKVILRNILIKNKAISLPQAAHLTQSISFQHDDYLVSFDFASLDYAEPASNQYQYKLEGFDENWIALGTFNRATFTNLPAGHYQLKVRGSNNHGLWSEPTRLLDIRVLPAWWQSWWALSLYAAAFVIIMLGIIRQQAKRLVSQEMIQQQINEQVATRTRLLANHQQELNAQLKVAYQNAIYDPNTGLPGRRFCAEILSLLLNWQQALNRRDTHPMVFIDLAMVKLEQAEPERGEKQNQFAPSGRVHDLFPHIPGECLFAGQWQENQLLLIHLKTDDYSLKLPPQVSRIEKWVQISLPCEGFSANIPWEKILLIMEHLLFLQPDTPKTALEITAFRVRITRKTIHQILSCQSYSELSEFLVLEPSLA